MAVSPPREASGEYVYELHPSNALPVINCKRYVKDVIFSTAQLKIVNRWLHRGRYLFSLSFLIGVMSSFALCMAPARVGRWVGVSLLAMEGPPTLATLISLRYDMLVLLGGVFEIWYTSLLNLGSMVMMAAYLQDARGIGMIMAALAYVLIVLIDANNRSARHTITVSVLGSLLYMSTISYVTLGLVDQANTSLVLLTYGPHQLMTEDVITNGLATGIVIFVRNAFRKWIATNQKNQRAQPFVVPCITYRCRLELRLVTSQSAPAQVPVRSGVQNGMERDDQHSTQLRCVPIPTVFDARATVLDMFTTTPSPRFVFRFVRPSVYVTAVAAIALSYVPPMLAIFGGHSVHYEGDLRIVVWAGLAATITVAIILVAFYQRGLLRRLYSNFDYLFVSSQITLAMVAAGDLFSWDARCLSLMTNWVWIHLVLSLDALPPVWRVHLGVSKRYVVMLLAFSIVQYLSFGFDVMVWEGRGLRDREIFAVSIAGRRISVRIVPFLFGRLVSMLSWPVRLLWRYWKHWPQGLVLLQGRVEYTDTHMAARHRNKHRLQEPGVSVSPVAIHPVSSSNQ